MLAINQSTPIQALCSSFLDHHGVRLLIKRIDLIDSLISGNKWYKLKYNLEEAKRLGYDTLLSFGGAYSNHIYALAATGRQYGFKTIGVIRGEAYEPLNPILKFASDQGMKLHYICRADYRKKHEVKFRASLDNKFGDFYLIPEGGSNGLAVKGCKEIVADIGEDFDVVACACGTGGTLAGLVTGLHAQQQALGFAVLKGADFLKSEVVSLISAYDIDQGSSWEIMLDYHFGGYAKSTPQLLDFLQQFTVEHDIPLEPIYTGKMMFGLYDLIRAGYFERGSTIVAIHSGGLQMISG